VTLVAAAAVAVGGAVGATARAVVGSLLDGRRATAVVNVVGSLLLGAVTAAVATGRLSPTVATLLGTGLCGAFTTYSSLAVETESLLADGDVWTAVRFGGGTLLAAVAGAVVGGWIV
jgi:CrcB protein